MGSNQLTVSNYVSPGMVGLNGLADVMCTHLARTNTYFSRYIAKSVFSYYCCAIAYARLLTAFSPVEWNQTRTRRSDVCRFHRRRYFYSTRGLQPIPLRIRENFPGKRDYAEVSPCTSLIFECRQHRRILWPTGTRYTLSVRCLPLPCCVHSTNPSRCRFSSRRSKSLGSTRCHPTIARSGNGSAPRGRSWTRPAEKASQSSDQERDWVRLRSASKFVPAIVADQHWNCQRSIPLKQRVCLTAPTAHASCEYMPRRMQMLQVYECNTWKLRRKPDTNKLRLGQSF